MRKDKDSLGAVSIPDDALYGSNSVRGAENFRLIGGAISSYPHFVIAMAKVKKAAAQANLRAGALKPELAGPISAACDEIIAGQHHDNFIVALAEGSGGTSTNMNFNEVIANRAGQILGDPLGSYKRINPNDHINMSQSTNDVIPTAVKLACFSGAEPLIDAATQLVQAFRAKADEYRSVLRLGRTCMASCPADDLRSIVRWLCGNARTRDWAFDCGKNRPASGSHGWHRNRHGFGGSSGLP